MTGFSRMALLGLAFLALAACGKKKSEDVPPLEIEAPGKAAAAAAASAGSGASATGGCAGLPDAAAIQTRLKAAMIDIYGVDQQSGGFVVTRIAASDCAHVTAGYRAANPGAETKSLDLVKDGDGKWSFTLYRKTYSLN